MYNKLLLSIFLLITINNTLAQDEAFEGPTPDDEFALVAYFGGGMSFYSSTPGTPAFSDILINKKSPIGTLRVLWHPDHRLKVGIETGYTTFYSYSLAGSSSRGKVELNVIPLLLEFSMTVYRNFHVYAGGGTYLLRSHLEFLGEVNSNFFSNGWMLGAAYIYPLNDNLGLAGEIKWLNAAETRDASICLQAQFVWKFYKW
ncbi:MAG: hypothetical protein ACR2GN_00700 [Bacteroidia bacterium]